MVGILRKIGAIAIIRETTTKENLSFFDKIKEKLEENKRPLLIFPQGTRVKLDEHPPFKKGVGRIYNALNLPCIPVALNTGKVWPKNSFMKYSGDIHISFLEPIMPGKEKDEFTKEIENKIYNEIKNIISYFLPKSGFSVSCPASIISFLTFLVEAKIFRSFLLSLFLIAFLISSRFFE